MSILLDLISILSHCCQSFIIHRSMEGKLVHLADSNVVFVIINSNVRHELTGGEYSSRRKQCNEAAQILGKKSLRDVAFEELLSKYFTSDTFSGPIDFARQCSHHKAIKLYKNRRMNHVNGKLIIRKLSRICKARPN